MKQTTNRGPQLGWVGVLALLAVLVAFFYHLNSFTAFDGFSTFSNDAGGYLLQARKWSPYFEPAPAENFTVPVHRYPPGFAAFLAITGVSQSLKTSHLAVSLCMLMTLLLIGLWMVRIAGQTTAILVTAAFCLIPGVIVHSLGVLSENLYLFLSIAALMAYDRFNAGMRVPFPWYFLVLALLAAAFLTRTVGLALVFAFFVVPMLDGKLERRNRLIIPGIALISLAVWQVWEFWPGHSSQLEYARYLPGISEMASADAPALVGEAWQTLTINLTGLLSSWNHYLFLDKGGNWFFAVSFATFVISCLALGLRLFRKRIDAVYQFAYLVIILLWNYPAQMTRFLHPVVLLLLLQPVLFLFEARPVRFRIPPETVAATYALILIAHLAFAQWKLIELKMVADSHNSPAAHSYDYYDAELQDENISRALAYTAIANLMAASAEGVPPDSIVGTLKHENYVLLANRKAVPLSDHVSHQQQLCNLLLNKADYVFLSDLAFTQFGKGTRAEEDFKPFSEFTWKMTAPDGYHSSRLIKLNPEAITSTLQTSGFDCTSTQYVQQSSGSP